MPALGLFVCACAGTGSQTCPQSICRAVQESTGAGWNSKSTSIKEVMLELNLERKEGGSQTGSRGEWVGCVRS